MSNQPIIFAVGGLVVGAFIGVALGGSMATDKINSAVSNALASAEETAGEASSATQEAVAALGERISAIETQLSDSASSTTEISEAVRAQLGEMQEALSSSIAELGESADQGSAELRAALEDMRAGMRERMQGMRDGMTSSDEEGAASDETAESAGGTETAEPDEPSAGEGTSARAGETVRFADGAVRAFVSRVDAEGGSARISVNGDLATLAVGEAVTAALGDSECSVALTGVEGSSVTLASDCDSPSGGGDQAAEEAEEEATADVPAAPEDGFRPGQVAQLADGALRVFVSGLSADRSAARIAINGIETQSVAAGDSVEVSSGDRTCTVTVTGVGDGVVGLEGSCG